MNDQPQMLSTKQPNVELSPDIRDNLGTRRIPPLRPSEFPDAGATVQTLTSSSRPPGTVDVMLVNPPTPDGGIWIRSQHRVGRRSRENMIWPQVSLAQMAAILEPEYTVEIVDANALRMGWAEFERILEEKRPKYYLTQVTAPSLKNDMYGVFLAKALGAKTMAFGTHVTPMTMETMRPFPALDFILRGEPEMTLRELLDTLEGKTPSDCARGQDAAGDLARAEPHAQRQWFLSIPSRQRMTRTPTPASWVWRGDGAMRSSSTLTGRSSLTWTTCPSRCMTDCRWRSR